MFLCVRRVSASTQPQLDASTHFPCAVHARGCRAWCTVCREHIIGKIRSSMYRARTHQPNNDVTFHPSERIKMDVAQSV